MRRRLSIKLITGAGAALGALALASTTAIAGNASAAPGGAAKPTFALSSAGSGGALSVHASPGQTVHRAVILRNTTGRRIVVKLDAADIRNASNGNADYVTDRTVAAGRWIDLRRSRVHLAPHATQRIRFEVRVPEHAAAASHYAGIVAVDAADLVKASASKSDDRAASFSFARVNRQALPVTVRLDAPPTRRLAVRSIRLKNAPAGAGLVLALRPAGTVLTQSAPIKLRVSRGAKTIFSHAATLGQLFPGSTVRYRVPWQGAPTAGRYHVVGMIYPAGAARVPIDETVTFTPAAAAADEHARVTPGVATAVSTQIPVWIWAVLGLVCGLLLVLLIAFARVRRRGPAPIS